MAIAERATVIGLTGPFGSGCSTSAEVLRDRLGYRAIKLSSEIREEFKKGSAEEPTRQQLQELGDKMREKEGFAVLAQRALRRLEAEVVVHQGIALDGIRNIDEIRFLREQFGQRFALFALECPKSERWERLKPVYESRGEGRLEFDADDARDSGEAFGWGQQVQLCVDRSDVLLINDDEVSQVKLRKKVQRYIGLVFGTEPRYANPSEILMNLAYSASHGSKCLKRQVGAVLVAAPPDQLGEVVGTGFNENPPPTMPCVQEPAYGADSKEGKRGQCYRDIVRAKTLIQYAEQKKRCSTCGSELRAPKRSSPPWFCESCKSDLDKAFFPERAMTWCTAVHAEVAAILSAGPRARGTTLYTTAFPCFQCAEKLMQAGIAAIIYTEPYPDVLAADRLTLGKIRVARFEGVRSARFHEIFSAARPHFENQRPGSETE